jgi:hypothetical protein
VSGFLRDAATAQLARPRREIFQTIDERELGRRIYPGRCTKFGGKGVVGNALRLRVTRF